MTKQAQEKCVRIMCKTAKARGFFAGEVTDPYVQGFCKTAEAYGVNPVELMKVAGWGWLGDAWDGFSNGMKRVGQGLWGGIKALNQYNPLSSMINRSSSAANGGGKGVPTPMGAPAGGPAPHPMGAPAGGPVPQPMKAPSGGPAPQPMRAPAGGPVPQPMGAPAGGPVPQPMQHK